LIKISDNIKFKDFSDEELFDKIKKDDNSVFREIYERYWSKLYIYAYNVINDIDSSEDIIQVIFTDLWIRRKKLEIRNLSAYLYKSVRFQVSSHIRNKKTNIPHEKIFNNFLSNYSPADELEYNHLSIKIRLLIENLPEQRKKIFLMSREEHLTNQEIADQLGLSLQTVKNQISSALKYLRISIKFLCMFFFH